MNSLNNTEDDLQQEDLLTSTRERIAEINSLMDKELLPQGFDVDEDGVWYLQEMKNEPPQRIWISSPLWVTGYTRDQKSENHGRILEFQDVDGCKHQWTMPMDLLAGEGVKVLGTLLNKGLRISPKKKDRDRLLEYIMQCRPVRRARCVLQCGWYNQSFVLPTMTIGYAQNEKIVYQHSSNFESKVDSSESISDWREKISLKACGNSRLILSISAAFTGPILHLVHHENIGVHLRGNSSLGKSTAGCVANSVWGSKENIYTCRATANGLEGIAALHNDRLLCLDELGQISPHEAGQIIYMLGNGMGKGRASANALAKKLATWKLLFISNGELGLSQILKDAGSKVKAGQEVRLIEIPADTGKYGLFENLHGFEKGADFSDYLKNACASFYGVAAKAFLRQLVEDIEGAIAFIETIISGVRQRYLPSQASAQVIRVFNHLALIAAAGELATQYGISGWETEEAISGVMTCFQSWLTARGDLGMYEEKEAISRVMSYFEQFGESKFSPYKRDLNDNSRTFNRMGYRDDTDEGIEFYVFKDAFRNEICKDLDYHLVERVCIERKLLMPDSDGSPTRPERLPCSKKKTTRCYRFTPETLLN